MAKQDVRTQRAILRAVVNLSPINSLSLFLILTVTTSFEAQNFYCLQKYSKNKNNGRRTKWIHPLALLLPNLLHGAPFTLFLPLVFQRTRQTLILKTQRFSNFVTRFIICFPHWNASSVRGKTMLCSPLYTSHLEQRLAVLIPGFISSPLKK